MHTVLRTLLLSLLTGLGGAAAAAPAADPQQRVQEEVQSALLRLVEAGEIAPEQLATLRLDAPASRTPVFGAIIDARFRPDSDRSGLPVAAVTPGGSADGIGLRAGDRIVAVNEASLLGLGADAAGRAVAMQRLRDALVADADALSLRVLRDGGTLDLRGSVRMVSLPAYRLELGNAIAGATYAAGAGGSGDGVSRCGRISVFDAVPRGKQMYPAVLIAIDGETPGPTSSDVFRVEPGRRRLTVAEAIDSVQFSNQQQTIRNRPARDRYKDFYVDVQPGVTYRLGVQLVVENRNRIRDNSYWEPIIWSEAAETCR